MKSTGISRRGIMQGSAAMALGATFSTRVLAAAPPPEPVTPALIEAARKEGQAIYYTSTDTYKARYQQWRKNNEQAAQPAKVNRNIDQFTLSKDEKLELKKISLEFKGVQEKAYHLNLYLLDFDKQQPFPVKVAKKDTKEPITFGGHQFKILSGNDRFIRLKLLDSYQTP